MFTKTLVRTYNFFFNYPTPSNLTTLWNFGILGLYFLFLQVLSGMLLSFYFVATYFYSFDFVEWIMRDTYLGFFARYIHSNGASFFFFVYIFTFLEVYIISLIWGQN